MNSAPSGYSILEKIGEGGFGEVFKAIQLKTNQVVAIKCLSINPDLSKDKKDRYINRFKRETLLCSRLQHPNIVKLLDMGSQSDGLIYAVFEYIEGQSLKERLLESGPLSSSETANIMSQVLDALAHAHSQGVVHRDIKPANIMLNNVGVNTHVKVLDFGIGTLVNEVRQLDFKSLTLTQETLATPSYSAPEQLRGEPPTHKTDLYVWGLVFIECLTGTPAVTGSSIASVFQKQLAPSNVPLPPALVGHPVAEILRRALNKKVNERASSALEIFKSLSSVNLSTLVGSVTSGSIRTQAENQELEETIIDYDGNLYSGLTEQKQITAMCIFLNIFSNNSDGYDGEIINAIHRDQKSQCVDIATRYGAMHVGALGDTLLFYFGFPTASDNDSRLCARAALDIISHLRRRNLLLKYSSQGAITEAHVGIHSGIVTVHQETEPDGDTPNIAMALSRAAKSNQILCSEATQKILEKHIEFEADEALTLGMRAEKTSLFSLTGERKVEAFGFLRASHRHRSFIGREKELRILQALLRPDAENRSVHVFGEAGIGKSRLVHELRQIADEHTHFVAQCLPEYKNNALYPILSMLKNKYSLDTLIDTDAVEHLKALMNGQTTVEQERAILVLCAWLSLPLPSNLHADALSPNESKGILFNVLAYLLCLQDSSEVCDRSLFIFEDIHWADATSIEFLGAFVNTPDFKNNRHLFISTSRQVRPNSSATQIKQSIQVKHLNEEQSIEYISQLFDQQIVSKDVTGLIVNRTDGIPLFIEELVNTLKQKETVQFINGRYAFSGADKIMDTPNSLRDLLQQKLDGLNRAKETAQLAATVGRVFDYNVISKAAVISEEQLRPKGQIC